MYYLWKLFYEFKEMRTKRAEKFLYGGGDQWLDVCVCVYDISLYDELQGGGWQG